MTHAAIPFTYATLTGDELPYMRTALESRHLSGGGAFGKRVEALLTREIGSSGSLLTPSCTHALEMCALLLDITPGDEVIVPSFTFVSTANAFSLRGAKLVFADVRPDTLNIDPAHAETLVTSRTRALVCVHYGGVACDMPALVDLTRRHGMSLIEDNAHGLFGRYQGKPLGSFGSLATLSFHGSKNFTCGEGGALIVNDPGLLERAEIIRDKGTDRARFLNGQVDKYTWRDLGSSYVLADVLAAMLLAQLEASSKIIRRRRDVHEFYMREFAGWASESGVQLPLIPAGCESPYHLYYLILPQERNQMPFLEHMKRANIGCAFHYVPLNTTPFGIRQGGVAGACPVSESAALRIVRLPMHAELSEGDVQRVVAVAREFRPG